MPCTVTAFGQNRRETQDSKRHTVLCSVKCSALKQMDVCLLVLLLSALTSELPSFGRELYHTVSEQHLQL